VLFGPSYQSPPPLGWEREQATEKRLQLMGLFYDAAPEAGLDGEIEGK
jgi:hypothetical protein